MKLAEEILKKSKMVGIDPYKEAFKPCDLGIKPNDYGSFSDWCKDTVSAKWNPCICLEAVEFRKDGKPLKYRLLPKTQWIYPS